METRPIEELVKMDTFQDMSDQEIISIINYSVQIAAKDAAFAAMQAAQRQLEQTKIDAEKQIEAQANDLLNSIKLPVLKKVTDNGQI